MRITNPLRFMIALIIIGSIGMCSEAICAGALTSGYNLEYCAEIENDCGEEGERQAEDYIKMDKKDFLSKYPKYIDNDYHGNFTEAERGK